jgi:hypothetical protein
MFSEHGIIFFFSRCLKKVIVLDVIRDGFHFFFTITNCMCLTESIFIEIILREEEGGEGGGRERGERMSNNTTPQAHSLFSSLLFSFTYF